MQALTIRHQVDGCLEGVFVHGQIYVQVSRVVDPANYAAVGLPPQDLLDDVTQAWAALGMDVDKLLSQAASVTDEWEYTRSEPGADPTTSVRTRLTPRYAELRSVPLRLKTLPQILNPQPATAQVLHGLLDWIARADRAARRGEQKPELRRSDGQALFPQDEPWWLTDIERRNPDRASAVDDLEEARLDEADLTCNPREAGVDSSSDESTDDTGSECSLPAGPPPAARRRQDVRGRQAAPATVMRQVPAAAQAQAVRRRLRGKQSDPRNHPQDLRRLAQTSCPVLSCSQGACASPVATESRRRHDSQPCRRSASHAAHAASRASGSTSTDSVACNEGIHRAACASGCQ